MGPNLATSFWARMGLREEHREVCVRAIQRAYPDHVVEEFEDQGYCSFTLAVSPPPSDASTCSGELLVQIRPEQHALDIGIAEAARKTYGRLAPRVREVQCVLPGELQAVEMERLRGVPLAKMDVQRATWEQRRTLVESFARVIARAWQQSFYELRPARTTRADTPTETLWLDAFCTGKVGRAIVPKLQTLASQLPSVALRETARRTLSALLAIREFPVVLCHGDLIPSNVLVDEDSWEVSGLVDWAEAEWLPFGTCAYGLEYLLGGLETAGSNGGEEVKPTWRYHEGSEELRNVFWETVMRERREAEGRLGEVGMVKDLGVLLWFGYAWDEGRIDRVVNEEDDAVEVACLRAFLGVE